MASLILTESDRRRFEKFLKRDPETGCLVWIGGRDRYGYGVFHLNGKSAIAHRIAFMDAGGTLTEESPLVIHTVCDNPPCCEPRHLKAASHAENQAEKARKGRARSGSRSKTGLPVGAKRTPLGKFQARAWYGGAAHYLGTYTVKEEAAEASRRAKQAYLRGQA